MLVAAALFQSLAFAVFLLTGRFRGSFANRLLCAAFLLMAAVKADQLYQMRGGLLAYPGWGFVLAPLQPLLTPAIFFFVRARTNPSFQWRRAHAAHLIPAALYLLYLFTIFFRFGIEEKQALIEAQALSTPLNVFVVPALFDLVQIGYIVASVVVLARHGLALDRWFSRVDDKNLAWLKQLLIAWAAVFALHLLWVIGSGISGAASAGGWVMLALNAAHFVLINILLMLAIVDFVSQPKAAAVRYAASAQSAEERLALYQRAAHILEERRLFLDADLTLQELAEAVGAPARDLSEAINGGGEETFYSVVNKARIVFAKDRLIADPAARIIDIAFASGFNSKSAFNETFKKYAGQTPSQWRASSHPKQPLAPAQPAAE